MTDKKEEHLTAFCDWALKNYRMNLKPLVREFLKSTQAEVKSKPKKEKFNPLSCRPHMINDKLWSDFVAMRKGIKAPLTAEAVKRLIIKLSKMQADGCNVSACVQESIDNCWKGVFPVHGSAKPSKHNLKKAAYNERDKRKGDF